MEAVERILSEILAWFIDVIRAWFWRKSDDEPITELMYWLEVDA